MCIRTRSTCPSPMAQTQHRSATGKSAGPQVWAESRFPTISKPLSNRNLQSWRFMLFLGIAVISQVETSVTWAY